MNNELRKPRFLSRLSQRLLPAPFQIRPPVRRQLGDAFLGMLDALEDAGDLPGGEVKTIGNALFSADRCGKKMREKHGQDIQVVRMCEAIDDLRGALKGVEIVVHDPTGEPAPIERKDYEGIGNATVDANVTEPTITYVQRPIIMYKRELLQMAKVIISIPPPGNSNEPQRPE